MSKMDLGGTHRACPPEATLRRISPLLGRMGITRLADITWLDDIGIPVYQAVRPNGYTLSVSQGKGLSPILAKVSAAMEAIEGWHAERTPAGERTAAVGDIEKQLGYRIDELALAPRHHLNPGARLEWSGARRLSDGRDTVVPTEYLRLDARVTGRWQPPLFEASSNGLASGNTREEAILHGLYEVVERDALARAATAPVRHFVDIRTVDGPAAALLDLFAAAGVEVSVELIAGPVGVACFRVQITSDAFPAVFEGSGCHLDREVALCRALTEAAQSRATSIAGTRDDITTHGYRQADAVMSGRVRAPVVGSVPDTATQVRFSDVDSVEHGAFTDDLRLMVDRIVGYSRRDPIVYDYTRPEFGIPVVRVICPRLLHAAH